MSDYGEDTKKKENAQSWKLQRILEHCEKGVTLSSENGMRIFQNRCVPGAIEAEQFCLQSSQLIPWGDAL